MATTPVAEKRANRHLAFTISAGVIAGLGKHASRGEAIQRKAVSTANADRDSTESFYPVFRR